MKQKIRSSVNCADHRKMARTETTGPGSKTFWVLKSTHYVFKRTSAYSVIFDRTKSHCLKFLERVIKTMCTHRAALKVVFWSAHTHTMSTCMCTFSHTHTKLKMKRLIELGTVAYAHNTSTLRWRLQDQKLIFNYIGSSRLTWAMWDMDLKTKQNNQKR